MARLPSQSTPDAPQVVTPKRYVFLLLEGFSQLSFSCAIESLRLANGFDEKIYYEWLVISETGQPVTGSNKLKLQVDSELCELNRHDTLIVCAGEHVKTNSTPAILNWLRRETRRGVFCGAISAGAYTLAKAGLLDGKRVATHWEYCNALQESFPKIEVLDTLFVVDGERFTCAGGAAALDLLLHLIEHDYGADIAGYLADKMVYTSVRPADQSYRPTSHIRRGARNAKVSQALDIMSRNIEEPLSPVEIAAQVSISARQLERLFNKHLGVTPKSFYTGLRLQKARELLFQTNMRLAEICFACGFNSQTHFSKSYRAKFGVAPSHDIGRF